jgi:hypothetical protein
MNLVQISATALISYLGLAAGFVIAKLTTEELPTARKYFPWIQRGLFFVVTALMVNFVGFSAWLAVPAYLILAGISFIIPINLLLFYIVFGTGFFFASTNQSALLVISSLVFLFGMVSGSGSLIKIKDFWNGLLLLLLSNSAYFVPIAFCLLVR